MKSSLYYQGISFIIIENLASKSYTYSLYTRKLQGSSTDEEDYTKHEDCNT